MTSSHPPASTRKHILIVEDEALIANAISTKFKLEGFQATVAGNGKEGLERALAEHPDFILLDIIMPVMDGLKMLKKLRRDPWGETVPILLWTNLSESEQRLEAIKYGAADYLVKSDWTPDGVVKQVKLKLGVT